MPDASRSSFKRGDRVRLVDQTGVVLEVVTGFPLRARVHFGASYGAPVTALVEVDRLTSDTWPSEEARTAFYERWLRDLLPKAQRR